MTSPQGFNFTHFMQKIHTSEGRSLTPSFTFSAQPEGDFFREIATAKSILARRHFRSVLTQLQINRKISVSPVRNEYVLIVLLVGNSSSEQISLPVCCVDTL
jgi:hypothetical protein